MRRTAAVVGGVALLCLLSLGVPAAFGQSPTSGLIKVFVTIPVTAKGNPPSPIVITGVIGDYGTALTVNAKGKSDSNGNFERVRLTKGKFTVNATTLNQEFAAGTPSDFNSSNCSGTFDASPVSVPIVSGSGTGAYAGITGAITLSGQFAFIAPKTKKGACNLSGTPVGGWGAVTGSGTVSIG